MAVLIATGVLSRGGAVVESSGGTKYAIFANSTGTTLYVYKNIDGTPSLGDSDTSTTIHGGDVVGWCHAAIDSNDDIHIISMCTIKQGAGRDVAYCIYDTGTDTLSTWEGIIGFEQATALGAYGVSISIDSTDEPDALFLNRVKVTGSTARNVYHSHRDSSTGWDGPTQIGDRVVKTDVYDSPTLTNRNSDNKEAFYYFYTNGDPAYKTYSGGSWSSPESTYAETSATIGKCGVLSTTSGTVYRYHTIADGSIEENNVDTGYNTSSTYRTVSTCLVDDSDRYVFYIDTSGYVHVISNSGSGWTDEGNMGISGLTRVIAEWAYNNENQSGEINFIYQTSGGSVYYNSFALAPPPQSIPLDLLSFQAQVKTLSVSTGGVTIPLDLLASAFYVPTVNVSVSINVLLSTLNLISSVYALADVLPGAVSIPINTLSPLVSTKIASIATGGVTISPSLLSFTGALPTVSVGISSEINVPLDLLATSMQAVSIYPGAGQIVDEQWVTGGLGDGGGDSFSLTSWSPSSNDLILLCVAMRDETQTVTAAGNGITFTEIVDVDNLRGQTGITYFRGMHSSPSTGQITVTCTGNTAPMSAIACRFSGTDTSGTNGAGAIDILASGSSGPNPEDDNADMIVSITPTVNNSKVVAVGSHRSRALTVAPDEVEIKIDVEYGSGGDTTRASMWYQHLPHATAIELGEAGDLNGLVAWCAAVVSLIPAGLQVNVPLDLLMLLGATKSLSVSPGAVSMPMDTLAAATATQSLTVNAAVNVLLTTLAILSATQQSSIAAGAVQLPMNLLQIMGVTDNLSVSTGAVSIPINMLAVNTETKTLTISPGAVQVLMNTIAAVTNSKNLTVSPGAVQAVMNLLALAASTKTLTVSSALQVILDTLGLSGSALSLTVSPGPVQVLMDTLVAALNAATLSISTGGVQMPMNTLAVTPSAKTLSVSPGAVSVGLGLLELISTPKGLTVSPGAVQIILDLLAASGAPLDITVQNITGVVVLLDLLNLASATQSLSVATGAVQTSLNTLAFSGYMPTVTVETSVAILMNLIKMAGAVPVIQVSPGAVIIPIDLLSVTSAPPALNVSPGEVQILADTLALIGSAKTLTVVIGGVPVVIPINTLALSNQALQATLAPGAAGVDLATLQIAASVESILVGAVIQVLLNTLAAGVQSKTLTVLPGVVTTPLSSLILSTDILTTAVIPGGVTIPLDALLASPETQSILVGQITTILLDALSAGAAAPSVAITPGGIGVALGSVYLIPSANKINVYVPPIYAGADIDVAASLVTALDINGDEVTLITTTNGEVYVLTVEENTRFE